MCSSRSLRASSQSCKRIPKSVSWWILANISFDAAISLRRDRKSASTTGSSDTDAGRAATSFDSTMNACSIDFRALSSGRELPPRVFGLAASFIPMDRRRLRKEKIRELSSLISGLIPVAADVVRMPKMSIGSCVSSAKPQYSTLWTTHRHFQKPRS